MIADIAVIAAIPAELALLGKTLGARPFPALEPWKTYVAESGGRTILLVAAGMGKINAAAASAAALERFHPRLLINAGCAGAYHGSGLAVGDLAMATAEICADEGVETADGWRDYSFIGIPAVERKGKSFYNEFPLSLAASEQAAHLAAALGLPLLRGRFVTVSGCTGTTMRGAELFSRHGALCESMEGAAVAQVALLYGVDCMEIRGVSNMVEDRDLSTWDIPLAVERVQRFLVKFIESYTGA